MSSKEAKTLISQKINKAFLFEKYINLLFRYFKNENASESISPDIDRNDPYIDSKLNLNLRGLNDQNKEVNLTKQISRKECLSEPEVRISSELKNEKKNIEEEKITSRQNYQKTSKRNRSKKELKFKSQSKINHKKLFENDKILVHNH